MTQMIDGRSADLKRDRIETLKALFPEAFPDGRFDPDALRPLVADGEEEELPEEWYRFTWDGKRAAMKGALQTSSGTLLPCREESKAWDETENVYIEGDNLEVLKLLQKSYKGRLKMIYIDPPYNTGKDFVYRDDFSRPLEKYLRETGKMDDEGTRLTTNSDSSARYHTDWLNMIYPRLWLARHLLAPDGVIFISIDDHEVHNLRKVCDEVFGESNFVAQLIWERAFAPKNDAKYVSNSHDYVLMYAKQIDDFKMGRLPRTEEANARYSNPDNDPRGVWMSSDISVKTYTPENDYPITTPSGRVVEPPAGRCWRLSSKIFEERLRQGRIWFGPDGDGVPRIKRFLSELKFEGMAPTSLMTYKEVGHSQSATQELNKLMEGGYFDGPKPVGLLKRLLTMANLSTDSLVLDFFSGSATTAEAVMRLNAEDGGHRRYILVQLPEATAPESEAYNAGYKNICEIGKERIRRAGDKIKEEAPLITQDLDTGFRVYKLAESNVRKWEDPAGFSDAVESDLIGILKASLGEWGLNPNRTEEDLLVEVLLKCGFDLTTPVAKEGDIYIAGGGALFAVLRERDITAEAAEKIVALHRGSYAQSSWRVLFFDAGFRDDEAKANALHTLLDAGLPADSFVTI